MEKAKKLASLALCLIMSLSILAGCGGGGTGSPSTSQADKSPASSPSAAPASLAAPSAAPTDAKFAKEMTIYAVACSVIDPGVPAFYTPQVSWYTNNLYNTLAKITVDGQYIPSLATEWKTDDYKTFNFKLRSDVSFHNGEKLTADDVVFTIERGKTSKGTQAFDKWGKVDSYKVVGDNEITITCKAVNVDFIDDVASPACSILNRKAVTADAKQGTWIGTGPWKVSKFVVNQYTEFVRNDKYWGEKPKTEKLTFKTVPEQSAQLIMLENGELDSVQGLLPTYLPGLEKDPKYVCTPFVLNNTAYIGFNMNDPLMADLNFRMAVASAIKRDDCVASTRNGYAVPVKNGTFWGYTTEFKNNDIPIIPYDLKLAKEYLAKTSYKGEPIEIVSALSDHVKNSQVIQENLKAIGINIKIYETDAAGLTAYTPVGGTKHQMLVYSSSWNNVASSCKTLLYPGMTGNKANYNNPKVSELLDKASATVDKTQREALYKEIQKLVAQDIPYISIFNMTYEVVSQKGVGGMGLYSSLNHDFSYIYKTIQGK